MARKANMAQTEIPVGNEVGRKHDPDEAFEREFGAAKAAEQRAAYVEARRCNVADDAAEAFRWGYGGDPARLEGADE